MPAVVERDDSLRRHARAEFEVGAGPRLPAGTSAERGKAADLLAAAQREHHLQPVCLEHRAHVAVLQVAHQRRFRQVVQCVHVRRERRQLHALLSRHGAERVAADGDGVARDHPLPCQRQAEDARDLLDLAHEREGAPEFHQRAQFLDLAIEVAVQACRLRMRRCVADPGGRDAEQRLEERALLLVHGRAGWRPRREQAHRWRDADRHQLRQAERGGARGVEARADRGLADTAGHGHTQPVADVDRDHRAGDQQPPHHGAQQVFQQVVEIERGVQQLRRFQEGFEAADGDVRHGTVYFWMRLRRRRRLRSPGTISYETSSIRDFITRRPRPPVRRSWTICSTGVVGTTVGSKPWPSSTHFDAERRRVERGADGHFLVAVVAMGMFDDVGTRLVHGQLELGDIVLAEAGLRADVDDEIPNQRQVLGGRGHCQGQRPLEGGHVVHASRVGLVVKRCTASGTVSTMS